MLLLDFPPKAPYVHQMPSCKNECEAAEQVNVVGGLRGTSIDNVLQAIVIYKRD